uniref:Haloacid dehalogenase-like hydrolase domain-containing protein Sgpp n=1 Tax=Aegilops tauschii subsp. strangulata TaxID=200361 RepID=A0A452YUM0_AEGTS
PPPTAHHSTASLPRSPCITSARSSRYKNHTARAYRRGTGAPDMSAAGDRSATLPASLAPLEAILFDIDGTLCDSDPFHFLAFRELLQEVGFNNGVPITEEFYSANISGWHNDALAGALFPELEHAKGMEFMDRKEALDRAG